MMDESKIARFIAQLTKETETGLVRWASSVPPRELIEGTDHKIHKVYETIYRGIRLRLFQVKAREYMGEFGLIWADRVILQFLDESDLVDWQVERVVGLPQLLDSVMLRSSRVEEKIDAVLGTR